MNKGEPTLVLRNNQRGRGEGGESTQWAYRRGLQLEEGVPQGGIFSPLLANVYLNELDRWWYENFHLTDKKRYWRRVKGLGNYILLRYADDFIMLCNGTKQSAEDMKSQLQEFLDTELHLKLSTDKTLITHVQDSFDFLGFHVHYREGNDRPHLIVTPSPKNLQRLKDKIREMTAYNTTTDSDYVKLTAINAVLRGWSGYFKHVSSSRTFTKLDFWVEDRILQWLARKYRLGIYETLGRFKRHQTPTCENIGIQFDADRVLWRYIMAKEQHITQYRSLRRGNPYMSASVVSVRDEHIPRLELMWDGKSFRWTDMKLAALQRDQYKCTNPNCGSTQNLHVHHITPKAQRPDLALNLANLITLCEKCHITTHRTSLGNHDKHTME